MDEYKKLTKSWAKYLLKEDIEYGPIRKPDTDEEGVWEISPDDRDGAFDKIPHIHPATAQHSAYQACMQRMFEDSFTTDIAAGSSVNVIKTDELPEHGEWGGYEGVGEPSLVDMFSPRYEQCVPARLIHPRWEGQRARQWGLPGAIEVMVGLVEGAGFAEPLYVGDVSLEGGGEFKPHASHREGLDFDVSYIGTRVFGNAVINEPGSVNFNLDQSFDLVDNIHFMHILVMEKDVESVYVDLGIILKLKALNPSILKFGKYKPTQGAIKGTRRYEYLHVLKENKGYWPCILGPGGRKKIIHWPGHENHYHIRINEEAAKRRTMAADPNRYGPIFYKGKEQEGN